MTFETSSHGKESRYEAAMESRWRRNSNSANKTWRFSSHHGNSSEKVTGSTSRRISANLSLPLGSTSSQRRTQGSVTPRQMVDLRSPPPEGTTDVPLYQGQLVPVSMVRSFFELSALQWDDRVLKFSKFQKKVVLVINTSTAHPQAAKHFIQLNELIISRGQRGLVVLAFPCNLFGNGEPWNNHEIMNCLRHVRPGCNFKPRFHLMSKTCVNGANCHPVYEYLKQRLPFVNDASRSPLDNPQWVPCWSPVMQSDISDNFEKFLITHEGKPVKRLTASVSHSELEHEIDILLKRIPKQLTTN